jgi:DNA-directed RNA polymerase subunit RPC12/RpoP
MKFYYCENCKSNAEKPKGYADIQAGDYPAMRTSLEGSDVTAKEAIERAVELFSSPKYKGEVCADCGKSFADDEIRWVNESHPIDAEDIMRRVVAKFSWQRAETLGEYNRRAEKYRMEKI